MKKRYLILILLTLTGLLSAAPISRSEAAAIGESFISQVSRSAQLNGKAHEIAEDEALCAWVFELTPLGFIVVPSDDLLPPVLAYSTSSSYLPQADNPLGRLVRQDLRNRLQAPADYRTGLLRDKISNGRLREDFEQWPDPDLYSDGGWLTSQWNQTAPYNSLCPMDPVSNLRSLAGCPAVAIAQIIAYHQTALGTELDDSDDYYHNYAGRQYWIDNDYESHGFPPWQRLNQYLRELEDSWWTGIEPDYTHKAALIFAAGAAARQVFSSQGSGTFAVSQAYQAIQRFGFTGSELLESSAPDLYERINQNIKDSLPVLLAVVTPSWDAGHNLVIDGYNTNDFYHLNFGWGGNSDGWYLMPQGLPYQLSVIEGVVVDIAPQNILFSMPEAFSFQSPVDMLGIAFEMINLSSDTLYLTDHRSISDANLIATFQPSLPYHLPSGQSIYGILQPGSTNRADLEGEFRIRHNKGFDRFPISINPELIVSNSDPLLAPLALSISAYPNPFSTRVEIILDKEAARGLEIYNLRGQKIRSLPMQSSQSIIWDGRDDSGREVAEGLYLIKVSGERGSPLKLLKIRN